MPEIAGSVTVEVPAELVVEAAAALIEMAELDELRGDVAPTMLSERCKKASYDLLSAASGTTGNDLLRDPLTVEAYARAFETVADILDRINFRALATDVRELRDVDAAWEKELPVTALT